MFHIIAALLSVSACRHNGNPFEIFAKLFERQNYEDRELLHKLTSDCLLVSETTRLCERRCVLHIFEQVRSIFENITAKEYTVWFFVPRLNSYTTLEHVVSSFPFIIPFIIAHVIAFTERG